MIVSQIEGHWRDVGKRERSLWTRLFRKLEKNRSYETDMIVDSYNIKLVLWDASIRSAEVMLRENTSGWDAVVICSDATEPTTLEEPFKWWMTFRQEITPSTTLPIVTAIAALKRDLLSPRRYNISRQHGEFTAASFGGGAASYAELSAKTRVGLREFWYSLIRRIVRGRVALWEDEVRAYKARAARFAERRGQVREGAYRTLTGGERPGRKL